MKLNWHPQEAYKEYFLTSSSKIIEHRSVFRPDIEYFTAYGGRGSGKTFTFADAVVIEACLRPVRVLVTREIQDSIEESIKAEIEAAIESRGVGHFFDIQKTCINGVNGSRFIFKGLKNNIKNLKSIADVDIVLCEESENITKLSWDKLLPSIRPRDQVTRNGAPIIVVIFNPDDEQDDTYQRFVISPPENSVTKLLNYDSNKYFPPHLERQRLHFKKTRPLKDYEHEWLGKPKGAGADVIIDGDWIDAARFASKLPGFEKVGESKVGYDPAGQGKDSHAAVYQDGNILNRIDEWPLSPDLREASERAFRMATINKVNRFRYDECGGLGDGVAVFVEDAERESPVDVEIIPFNAGDSVIRPDEEIGETGKTYGETYLNAKAQAWGIKSQMLYNTYRFVVLGEPVDSSEMLSIDIEDDDLFNKLKKELKAPIWIKSATNSKKKVESKKDTEKRIGQPSGNIADAFIMCDAPYEIDLKPMFF